MARDPDDEREVLAAFEDGRRRYPDAAFLLGIVRDGQTEFSVVAQFGLLNCGPVEMVAGAHELLEAAAEGLRLSRHEAALPFLLMVESAMAALAFQPPESLQ